MPRWIFPTLFLLFVFIQSVTGQQLPIRSYTPADGLPSSFIQHILSDSRGYIWISTRNGLARFDGYQFVTYSTEHGLSHPTVNHVLESRSGDYWVATNGGGICSFFPKGDPEIKSRTLFRCYPVGESVATNRVNYVLEDHSGKLWAGTDRGVFVKGLGSTQFRRFQLPSQKGMSEYGFAVMAIIEDHQKTIWIRTNQAGLFRILPDGNVLRDSWKPDDTSWGALSDSKGQIWMSAVDGIQVLGSTQNIKYPTATSVNLRPIRSVRSLAETSDGLVWIATEYGLSFFNGKSIRNYTKSDGLTTHSLAALAEDKDGNLWIGTQGAGLMKLLRKGFLSYSQCSIGDFGPVHSINTSSEGQIYVASGDWLVHRFQGEKFSTIKLRVPIEFTRLWISNVVLLDSRGEWWAASDHGLLRFPKVHDIFGLEKSTPKIYTAKDGLASDAILKIYEDSSGDLWISALTAGRYGLTKWNRSTDTFHRIGEKDGLNSDQIATSFLDDGRGNLWIGYGYYGYGGLVRRRNNVFQLFSNKDGLPKGMITALHSDHSGRLWIATNYGGLARVDKPSGEKLTFATYTKRNGLSANDCRTITEDRWGRIYVGTVHGVDQLDPVSGKIHHYTMADGLNSDFITTAYSDQNGELWFGTYAGLSRLKPQQELSAARLQVLLTNVSLAGSPYALSELGEPVVSGIQLPHNRNHIQISFGAINFSLGENLRFQYKLDGADIDWNATTVDRSVHYASLSPGTYHFKVRAVDESGIISVNQASVDFTILKPIWLQWWFLTISMAILALLIHTIYRIRIARLLEIERLRTRIASDLHDDIGSSLSRIAILSDAVRRKVNGDAGVLSLLTNMAEASREAIDAMGDIVWAVNPKKDQLQDLENRMRHLAGEMLTERGVAFDCSPSDQQEFYILNPNVKRNVFLIFKECLHNVVRHSNATKVDLGLDLTDGFLQLEIRDNGKGFDSDQMFDGHGLRNIKKRAAELNGNVDVVSQPGGGATIRLRIPLRRNRLFRSA